MNTNMAANLLVRGSAVCLYLTNKATRPYLREIVTVAKEQRHRQRRNSEARVKRIIAGVAATTGSIVYSLSSQENESPFVSRLPSIFPQYITKAEPRQLQRSEAKNVMLHRMRSTTGRNLHTKYKVDWKTVLGEGAYGSVHPARLACTGEKVALKKIAKRYTNSSAFRNETEALLRIYDNGGHPNISGLRDMYEDYSQFYLILDLIKGGEMFDHLSNEGAYSEADSARLVFEVASALAFLHGGTL
jgi:ribosomal protein L17